MRALIAGSVVAVSLGLLVWLGLSAWQALTVLPTKDVVESASATVAEIVVAVPPAAAPERAAPQNTQSQRSNIRFVEEDGIVGVRIDGPLERAPARVQPQEPPPPPKEEPDVHRLVVIESAGVIDARSHKIRLAHVDAPDAAATCDRVDGGAWPCGRRARTALRRLIRRRAIECLDVQPVDPEAAVRASVCAVGGTDIGQWLVEQGWATPGDTAPEVWNTLHETAKAEQRGMFSTTGR